MSVGKPEPSAALPFPCPPHPFRRFLRLRVPPPLHPSRNNPEIKGSYQSGVSNGKSQAKSLKTLLPLID